MYESLEERQMMDFSDPLVPVGKITQTDSSHVSGPSALAMVNAITRHDLSLSGGLQLPIIKRAFDF